MKDLKVNNSIRLVIFLIILYSLDFIILANIIVKTLIISEVIIIIKDKIFKKEK